MPMVADLGCGGAYPSGGNIKLLSWRRGRAGVVRHLPQCGSFILVDLQELCWCWLTTAQACSASTFHLESYHAPPPPFLSAVLCLVCHIPRNGRCGCCLVVLSGRVFSDSGARHPNHALMVLSLPFSVTRRFGHNPPWSIP